MRMKNVRRKDVKDTALDGGVQTTRTRPKVSMSCVRVMEGFWGRRRRRKGVKEGRRQSLHKWASEECLYPGAEQTYLQRLNKTSLCQTKQGMAGHSLCGAEGGEGRGEKAGGYGEKDEEVEGWREEGGRGGERRTLEWVSHGRFVTRHGEMERGRREGGELDSWQRWMTWVCWRCLDKWRTGCIS